MQSKRPQTAPTRRNDTPFDVVQPVLKTSQLIHFNTSRRTYSASRLHHPTHIPFTPSVKDGKGSMHALPEVASKHSPSFEYTFSRAEESADTAALMDRLKRSFSTDWCEEWQPKAKQRGAIIACRHASSPEAHRLEQYYIDKLKEMKSYNAGGVGVSYARSSSLSSLCGVLPHADVGSRSRLPEPSGPSLASAIRPDWTSLAVYVAPCHRGPAPRFATGAFVTQLHENGKTASEMEMKENGGTQENFQKLNRKQQVRETKQRKIDRIHSLNSLDASRRAQASLNRARARADLEAAHAQLTLKHRAVTQLVSDRAKEHEDAHKPIAIAKKWLPIICAAQFWAIVAERIIRARHNTKRANAAFTIMCYFRRYKARQQVKKIEELNMRNRKLGLPTSPRSAGSPTSSQSPRSPRLSLSPRHSVSTTAPTSTGSPGVKRGGGATLAGLSSYQARQRAGKVLAGFHVWLMQDQFRYIRHAMLSLRRKAIVIQRWWRAHLLRQHYRLSIQVLQFLSFRDRVTRSDFGVVKATPKYMEPTHSRSRSNSPNNKGKDKEKKKEHDKKKKKSDEYGINSPTYYQHYASHYIRGIGEKYYSECSETRAMAIRALHFMSHDSSAMTRQIFKKFTPPVGRSSDRAPIIIWNLLVDFMRQVFIERLNNRAFAFRQYIKDMAIEQMRGDLLAASGTVSKDTKFVPSVRAQQVQLEKLRDSDKEPDVFLTAPAASASPSTPRNALKLSTSSSASDLIKKPILFGSLRTHGTSPSSLAYLSNFPTPSFYRLLLSDSELHALYRGITILLRHLVSNPRAQAHYMHSSSSMHTDACMQHFALINEWYPPKLFQKKYENDKQREKLRAQYSDNSALNSHRSISSQPPSSAFGSPPPGASTPSISRDRDRDRDTSSLVSHSSLSSQRSYSSALSSAASTPKARESTLKKNIKSLSPTPALNRHESTRDTVDEQSSRDLSSALSASSPLASSSSSLSSSTPHRRTHSRRPSRMLISQLAVVGEDLDGQEVTAQHQQGQAQNQQVQEDDEQEDD